MGFVQLTSVANATAWLDRAFAGHLGSERLPIAEAIGRVLASEVRARRDAPPFDRAVADGYAVDAEATLGASVYNPLPFRIRGCGCSILPSATAVACGASIPPHANAVVARDHTQADALGKIVELIEPVAAGANIERFASEFARGALLLDKGRRLGSAELGLLAEGGIGTVDVIRRPRARVIVTRRDLTEAGTDLSTGAVFDANTPMLRGLIKRDGGTIDPCAVDRCYDRDIRAAVEMPGADLVIVVGGSGHGPNNDESVLEALGRPGDGESDGLRIHGIALRPGLSSGIGCIRGRPLFLLPGSPAACFWAYEMLTGRVVRRLAGYNPKLPYAARDCVTSRKIVSSIGFLEVWPVRFVAGQNRIEAVSAAAPDGTGGLLPTIVEADGFVLVPEGSEGYPAGAHVRVYLYNERGPGPDIV